MILSESVVSTEQVRVGDMTLSEERGVRSQYERCLDAIVIKCTRSMRHVCVSEEERNRNKKRLISFKVQIKAAVT